MARLTPPLRGFARGFLLYALLPNAAFAALGQVLFLVRPAVNVDYLALWAIAGRLPSRLVAALYALLLLLDLAVSGEAIYEFSTADALLNVRYLPQLEPAHLWAIGVAATGFLAAFAFLARRRAATDARARPRRRAAALAAVAGVGAAVAFSALDVGPHPLDPSKDVPLAGSRVLEVIESGAALVYAPQWASGLYPPAQWRGAALLRDLVRAGERAPYDVVLVLAESDGLLRDDRDQARVMAPLTGPAVARRYAVTRGTLPFKGSTLSGELRALCGIRGSPVVAETADRMPPCLPKLLHERGYEALSFHGNSRAFFDRARWYPQLGFDLSYFAEELNALPGGPPAECGVLIRGACDADVARAIHAELARAAPRPKFVYWLTLSSHLPVDTVLARDASFDCAATGSLRDADGPCGLERILYRLHEEVARIALDPALPPTRFILVGDHAPVFAERAERALYDSARVPFVDLVPIAPGGAGRPSPSEG